MDLSAANWTTDINYYAKMAKVNGLWWSVARHVDGHRERHMASERTEIAPKQFHEYKIMKAHSPHFKYLHNIFTDIRKYYYPSNRVLIVETQKKNNNITTGGDGEEVAVIFTNWNLHLVTNQLTGRWIYNFPFVEININKVVAVLLLE